jgi:hypothetical protein
MFDFKASARNFVIGTVLSAVVVFAVGEGLVPKLLNKRNDELIAKRSDIKKEQGFPLTEDRVRAIVQEETKEAAKKDDLKAGLKPLIDQLDEMNRRLSSRESDNKARNAPRP